MMTEDELYELSPDDPEEYQNELARRSYQTQSEHIEELEKALRAIKWLVGPIYVDGKVADKVFLICEKALLASEEVSDE